MFLLSLLAHSSLCSCEHRQQLNGTATSSAYLSWHFRQQNELAQNNGYAAADDDNDSNENDNDNNSPLLLQQTPPFPTKRRSMDSQNSTPESNQPTPTSTEISHQQQQQQSSADNSADTPLPTTTNDSATDTPETWMARYELASYLFTEFYEKNLSNSLTDPNSPAQLVPVSIHTSSNEPVQFAGSSHPGTPTSAVSPSVGSSAGSGGGGGLFLGSGSGGSGGGSGSAASTTMMSAANGSVPLHATAASVPIAAGSGGRPYFGDALYSFQAVYWPIHCVICLAICTLGIFANVTNIIVLTR